ncbi:adenine deaminase [Sporobolomyces koalae]|uniref:adenine deaminase n=1 Tax=Sporobolomyces koalae TaxID=500713 RepID=UPI0031711E5C
MESGKVSRGDCRRRPLTNVRQLVFLRRFALNSQPLPSPQLRLINPKKMCSDNAIEFLTSLPKCEHHIHIEGSLEPELLFTLAEKNKIALAAGMYTTIDALKTRYENFTSLDDFLAYFNAAMDVLLYEDDFAALAYTYMKRVSTDGLVHTEVFFDPQAHTGRGIALETVVEGLTKGLKQGEAEFGISHKLIMCFVKHLSVQSAVDAVGDMAPYFANGLVCGLGADSTEKNNPPSKFADVYAKARQVNVPHLTMHSGEEGPAAWVRETLALGINRVDHGVHAADDPELLKELASRNTLLTVCPLSNVRLRVHKDVSESPIPLLLEAGVPFSINSDDPSYFGGYILDNYLAVHKAFKFSKETWRTIAVNSVNGSWCDEARKKELHALIEAHFDKWASKEI